MVAETFSASDTPQLAQFIQRGFHPLDRGRVGLRTAAPTQAIADLLEHDFAAHRPIQHVRSDLAGGLRRLAVSLPMEELLFALCHSREAAEIFGEDSVEVDRYQWIGQAGVIPVMAILLPGRVLLLR